jgi:DNA helicase II / ATP-dependent DNA helicase PcrA
VLLARVRHLVEVRGVKPEAILLLTYSRATVLDLKKRLQQQTRTEPAVHTFHSFGLHLIGNNCTLFGYRQAPQFTETNDGRDQAQKRLDNVIDFADMVRSPLALSKENSSAFQKIISEYRHVLVDELQDLDGSQTELLSALGRSPSVKSLVMVGDHKQLIYGFLGASTNHWKYLEEELSPKSYTLTRTFRLPPATLPLANAVAGDLDDCHQPLTSRRKKPGSKPRLHEFTCFDAQRDFIADTVEKLLDKGCPPYQIACLARERWDLDQLQTALKRRDIDSYLIVGGRDSETQSSEADHQMDDTLLILLRIVKALAKNPKNKNVVRQVFAEEGSAMKRVLLSLGVSEAQVQPILTQLEDKGWQGLKVKASEKPLYTRLNNLKKVLVNTASRSPEAAAKALVLALRGFMKKGKKKQHQLQQMNAISVALLRKTHWNDVSLDSETLIPPAAPPTKSIQLCTSHSAKGKEWRHVFVIDFVNGMYPATEHGKRDPEHLDQERRLFFVTVTRHRRRLYLLQSPVPKQSFAVSKKPGGKTRQIPHLHVRPSQFYLDYKDYIVHAKNE